MAEDSDFRDDLFKMHMSLIPTTDDVVEASAENAAEEHSKAAEADEAAEAPAEADEAAEAPAEADEAAEAPADEAAEAPADEAAEAPAEADEAPTEAEEAAEAPAEADEETPESREAKEDDETNEVSVDLSLPVEIDFDKAVTDMSDSMTTRELKEMCRKFHLSTAGKKIDMANRIKSHQRNDAVERGADIVLVA